MLSGLGWLCAPLLLFIPGFCLFKKRGFLCWGVNACLYRAGGGLDTRASLLFACSYFIFSLPHAMRRRWVCRLFFCDSAGASHDAPFRKSCASQPDGANLIFGYSEIGAAELRKSSLVDLDTRRMRVCVRARARFSSIASVSSSALVWFRVGLLSSLNCRPCGLFWSARCASSGWTLPCQTSA